MKITSCRLYSHTVDIPVRDNGMGQCACFCIHCVSISVVDDGSVQIHTSVPLNTSGIASHLSSVGACWEMNAPPIPHPLALCIQPLSKIPSTVFSLVFSIQWKQWIIPPTFHSVKTKRSKSQTFYTHAHHISLGFLFSLSYTSLLCETAGLL